MNKVNAIILAGTHADESKLIDDYDGEGPKNKALAKIRGKPLILNVLNAVKNVECINKDKIAIVGPKLDLEKIIRDREVQIIQESKDPKESRRFIENVTRPYDFLSPNGEPTLYVPSDVLLIAKKIIEDFVSDCNKHNAALYLALINAKNIPKGIEGLKKSAKLHLYGGGYFRTANMLLYEDAKIKNRAFIESKIKIAFPLRRTNSWVAKVWLYTFMGSIYPKQAYKYFIKKRLTKQDIENAFRKKPGFEFKIIETKDPRAVVEIDYQDEFDYLNNEKNYKKIKEICENYASKSIF